jgi:hypothetical protein
MEIFHDRCKMSSSCNPILLDNRSHLRLVQPCSHGAPRRRQQGQIPGGAAWKEELGVLVVSLVCKYGTWKLITSGEPWNMPRAMKYQTNTCEAVEQLKSEMMQSFSVSKADRCIAKNYSRTSLSKVFETSAEISSNASFLQESSLMVTS